MDPSPQVLGIRPIKVQIQWRIHVVTSSPIMESIASREWKSSPGPGPISPTWNPSTRGLRYVWPRTFWDPDPAPRSRDGHVRFKVIISKVELHGVTDRSRSVQRRPMYHLPAPTLHIPRITAQLCNRDRGVDNYVCRLGAMFIFRIFRAIHRSHVHNSNNPPSTDT